MSKKMNRDDQINHFFGDFLAWCSANGKPKFAASTLEFQLFAVEYQQYNREMQESRAAQRMVDSLTPEQHEEIARSKRTLMEKPK